MWQADVTFGVSGLILTILALIFQKRQRAASFAEVFVVTLASLLLSGVTAAVLLLDTYARGALWQLTITRLSQLTHLPFLTVLVMNAVRKKELAPKKLRLTWVVMLATFLALSYPWNPAYVIAVTLVALLGAVVIIRGPN